MGGPPQQYHQTAVEVILDASNLILYNCMRGVVWSGSFGLQRISCTAQQEAWSSAAGLVNSVSQELNNAWRTQVSEPTLTCPHPQTISLVPRWLQHLPHSRQTIKPSEEEESLCHTHLYLGEGEESSFPEIPSPTLSLWKLLSLARRVSHGHAKTSHCKNGSQPYVLVGITWELWEHNFSAHQQVLKVPQLLKMHTYNVMFMYTYNVSIYLQM